MVREERAQTDGSRTSMPRHETRLPAMSASWNRRPLVWRLTETLKNRRSRASLRHYRQFLLRHTLDSFPTLLVASTEPTASTSTPTTIQILSVSHVPMRTRSRKESAPSADEGPAPTPGPAPESSAALPRTEPRRPTKASFPSNHLPPPPPAPLLASASGAKRPPPTSPQLPAITDNVMYSGLGGRHTNSVKHISAPMLTQHCPMSPRARASKHSGTASLPRAREPYRCHAHREPATKEVYFLTKDQTKCFPYCTRASIVLLFITADREGQGVPVFSGRFLPTGVRGQQSAPLEYPPPLGHPRDREPRQPTVNKSTR